MSVEVAPAVANRAQRVAALVICALLAFCLGTGFFVSWDALQVAATAAHASPMATRAYAFCVDGVIAIALAASVVLRHTPGARRYSLRILAVFSLSSVVLNIAHGLGAFEGKVAWPLLALTAANAPAAIGFGSHLFVKTLQVLFPSMDGSGVPVSSSFSDLVPGAAPVPVEALDLTSSTSTSGPGSTSGPTSSLTPGPTSGQAAGRTSPKRQVGTRSKPKVEARSEVKVDEVELQRARHADRAYQAANAGQTITRDELKKALGCGTDKATALMAALKREREAA